MLFGFLLYSFAALYGQQLNHEYSYDNAGNRTTRTIIQLNSKRAGEANNEELCNPLTDVLSSGETMRLFPNPTQETIRLELLGDKKIGRYTLTDITGRLVIEGSCETPSLTLNLSAQSEGIYLLEFLIDEKPHIYKIIKQ